MLDEDLSKKYFLGFYGWHPSTRKYISEEAASKILQIYDFLRMINSIEENYDIVLNNFFDLYNSLSEISIRNNISFIFKPTDMFYDKRLVIRKINNLLSSCRLFLDQNLSLLSDFNKDIFERYKTETHRLYDEYFSYRLCEQLRNTMQHRCLPIELEYAKNFANDKSEKAIECILVSLNIRTLLAFDEKKLKSSFRNELKNTNKDKLDLWLNLEEYVTKFGQIILFIRRNTIVDLTNYKAEYIKLLSENQQIKTDEVYEIQKIVYLNRENSDGTVKTAVISNSLVTNIELLQEKNDAIKDFSKHEIRI